MAETNNTKGGASINQTRLQSLQQLMSRMAQYSDPFKVISSQMAWQSDPVKEAMDRMAQYRDPFKAIGSQMAWQSDPIKEAMDRLTQYSDPLMRVMNVVSGEGALFRSLAESNIRVQALEKMVLAKSDAATLSQTIARLIHGEAPIHLKVLREASKLWVTPAQGATIQSLLADIEKRLNELTVSDHKDIDDSLREKRLQASTPDDLDSNFSSEISKNHYVSSKESYWFLTLICCLHFISISSGIASLYDYFYRKYNEKDFVGELYNPKKLEEIVAPLDKLLKVVMGMIDVILIVRPRVTKVRSEPRHGAKVEGYLMPYERVVMIGKKGWWAQIKYYDKADQEERIGWVLKKYLKRM